MTFKNKLPSKISHPRQSVLHLASALNVSPDEVMNVLSDIGEHVPSMAKKTLEEPVVRTIYDHFGRTYLSDPVHPCSQWRRHGTDTSQPARSRKHPKPHQSPTTGPYTTYLDTLLDAA